MKNKFNGILINSFNFILLLFLIIGFGLSFKFISLNFYNQHMDTAGMADLINNIANSNNPVSSLWSSARPFLVIWQNIDFICQDKFRLLENFDYNLLKNHSWYNAYLLSIPVKMGLNAKFLVILLINITYFFSFTLIFIYLYKKKINPFISFFFLIFLMANPLVSESLYGQMYFSKLFIFPCLLFLFIYNNNKFYNIYLVSFFIIILSLFHERASLFIGLYLIFDIFFKILRNKTFSKQQRIIFLLAIYCLFIFFKTIYFTESPHKGASLQIFHNISLLMNDFDYQLKVIKIFVVLFPYLFFCIFAGKFFLLILLFLLPNILMNIGGSEKLGWSVHYYSYIMPFIFYFSLKGFIVFKQLISQKFRYLIHFILFVFVIHSFTIEPYNHNNLINYKNIKKNKITKNYVRLINNNSYEDLKKKINQRKAFFSVIPEGVSISMRENHSTYFSAKNYDKISFFPIWIGMSDYVIVDMVLDNNKFEIYLDALLPPKNELFKARNCINSYLSNNYEEIDTLNTSSQTKTIIFKKIN